MVYSGINVELREIVLRDKPKEMIQVSPKGTVPVLVFTDGSVMDESIDILRWSISKNDPDHWLPGSDDALAECNRLIDRSDNEFKVHLDHYKYADRFPDYSQVHYRNQGEEFLAELESRLNRNEWLVGEALSIADIAVFPFIRQFAHVDKEWFYLSDYKKLQQWLDFLLESPIFKSIMTKYKPWKAGDEEIIFPGLS